MTQNKKVWHPYLVTLVALVLPGCGQVLNGQPTRGFQFLFFTLVLGWVSYRLTTPDHSLIGRYAGGIFVYSLAVLDAYRVARLRQAAGTPGAKGGQ